MIARANDSSSLFDPQPSTRFGGSIAQAPKKQAKPRRVDSRNLYSLALTKLASGQPFVAPSGNRSQGYRLAKRTLDMVGALGLIVLLSPIMLVTFLVLLVTTKGRPLFVQERLGYLGRPFPMIKFRTMRLNAAAMQAAVKNEKSGPIFKNRRDPRITRIGRILRSTSIDEMPQLFNVLLGHMSLVGPRPPLAIEVIKYEPWQRQRLSITPGLTCFWQIRGRSEIDFVDWVRLDLAYAKNQNFWTDLHILLHTPASVLSCKGAY